MGSVGEDYVCPHCDGRGYGGYIVDGLNYAICTEGEANCLDKLSKGLHTRAMVKRSALKMVFVIRHFRGVPDIGSAVSDIVNYFSQRISEFL